MPVDLGRYSGTATCITILLGDAGRPGRQRPKLSAGARILRLLFDDLIGTLLQR
jgi:hypothetical protein